MEEVQRSKEEKECFKKKVFSLRTAISDIALRCGRDPKEIQWILVTKTVSVDRILSVFEAGITDFGENRVQELFKKKDQLPPQIRWHMVGHLQTNKVKYVLDHIVLIHSLDRVDLALEIEEQASEKAIENVDCLIQVNSSGEETKYGFEIEDVEGFVESLPPQSRIRIRGLMTIGPLTEDRDRIRRAFKAMKSLQGRLKKCFPEKDWNILSMGMSNDYDIAIEEGANLLRIGTAFFGSRSRN